MAEPTLAQGLTALLTPIATVGAGAYTTQTKSKINADRIKAGKQPCTGQYGQPDDCPSIFAPGAPTETATDQTGGGGYAPQSSGGVSPVLIVALLAGAGLVIFLLMSSKKAPTTPTKRKKSRRK